MESERTSYFINNPIFVKYKTRWDFFRLKRKRVLKTVFVNERIIELPFAIESLCALPKGAGILDLGCTESLFPLQAAGLGYHVAGLDFRPYPYAHPNLTCVRGDMCRLPFENDKFDGVFSLSSLEHVGIGFYEDPASCREADRTAVEEIYRVLKEGGLFVVTVPYGKASVNSHQRVYDAEGLKTLLEKFDIQEKKHFQNFTKDGVPGNFWEQVSPEKAAQVESAENTAGVCLIKATKPVGIK